MLQIFETTAISVEGEQRGTYYGSVEWGVRTDASTGTPSLLPFTVKSMGVPTNEFMESAESWNAQDVWVSNELRAAGAGTVASIGPATPGAIHPAGTVVCTITTATGATVNVTMPEEATLSSINVVVGQAVAADELLAVIGRERPTQDLPITTHRTADPSTLDDRALERRIRELCDAILGIDRTSPDYQNMRFEIRGLAQVAQRRGGGAVDSGHTYRVKPGDTLWEIAARYLGNGPLWTRIFALNVVDLQDPNVIHAGTELHMPTPYRGT